VLESTVSSAENKVPTNAGLAAAKIAVAQQRAFQEAVEQQAVERRRAEEEAKHAAAQERARDDADNGGVVISDSLKNSNAEGSAGQASTEPAASDRGATVDIQV
jgi:hypothetical protein